MIEATETQSGRETSASAGSEPKVLRIARAVLEVFEAHDATELERYCVLDVTRALVPVTASPASLPLRQS